MSAIESYENLEYIQHVGPEDIFSEYLEQVPVAETRNGHREYDLLCAAMQSDQGRCAVRKDPNAHSDDPTDWLVIRDNGTDVIQDTVLSASTILDEDGDKIELLLAADVSYHGPYTLKFSVDKMYGPNNKEIVMTHIKYYGRGVDVEPEEFFDMKYDKPIIENQKLADVIPIEIARERRRKLQDVGHTALAN